MEEEWEDPVYNELHDRIIELESEVALIKYQLEDIYRLIGDIIEREGKNRKKIPTKIAGKH